MRPWACVAAAMPCLRAGVFAFHAHFLLQDLPVCSQLEVDQAWITVAFQELHDDFLAVVAVAAHSGWIPNCAKQCSFDE